MSAKTRLYTIAKDLKAYLEWQAEHGAVGSKPASKSQREAFRALEDRRKREHLEAARRKVMGEASDETAPRPDQPEGASRGSESEEASSDEVGSAREEFKKRFGQATEKKPPKTPGADGSDDKPWKRIGSRPRPTFGGGGDEKQAKSSQKSRASQNSSPEKTQNMTDSSDSEPDTAPGPQYDENAYPEANGAMMEGAVDMEYVDEPSSEKTGSTASGKSSDDMSNAEKLEFLEEYLGDCQRCRLCESRTNIAFGDGSPDARLVFVGEAPGYNEDQQGIPFVGKAGQLLTQMIEAMGLERQDVYICNVIKCRPPDNRNPHPDEIQECSPFLRKQLEVISPEVIVSLGKFASQWLLGLDESMGRMRGQWHEWEDTAVMPTYHPAYLLRQDSQKRKTWADLQMVMKRLEL